MKEMLGFKSWWVWTFAIICFGLYEQGSMKLEREITSLNTEVNSLARKIADARLEQEELTLQIASFSDPAWVELVLIRALGVIPEGSTKVYYRDEAIK